MSKKCLLILAILIALGSAATADLRNSRRSEYVNKYIVLKKLVRFSNSKSEKVMIESLNKIREVIFRSQKLISVNLGLKNDSSSIAEMVNRMNNDVDKIYEGMINLENAILVADLADKEDQIVLTMLKNMIVSEIKLGLSSNYFLESQEKNGKMLDETSILIKKSTYQSSSDKRADLLAIENLQKLMDLSWYIFAEQSQWLMTTAFRLECINFAKCTMNGAYFITPDLNITKPPRMFIPSMPQDYDLKGCPEVQILPQTK